MLGYICQFFPSPISLNSPTLSHITEGQMLDETTKQAIEVTNNAFAEAVNEMARFIQQAEALLKSTDKADAEKRAELLALLNRTPG